MRIRIREDFRVGTVGTGSLASGTSHGDRFCGSRGDESQRVIISLCYAAGKEQQNENMG